MADRAVDIGSGAAVRPGAGGDRAAAGGASPGPAALRGAGDGCAIGSPGWGHAAPQRSREGGAVSRAVVAAPAAARRTDAASVQRDVRRPLPAITSKAR